MAIAFRSKTNTSYASTTNTVLTAPAGLADGDIMVAVLFVGSGSAPSAPTPPAGWAAFGTPTTATAGGFFTNFGIFWKRASSESGSYTFTHATYSTQGLLKAYSGCLASGTPLSATSNNTGTGSTATGTSITTTAANSYLLFESHNWVGSGALSPPTGMTERLDILVYSADELIASAGATGNRTQANGNAGGDAWAVRMVELLADTGGGGTTYDDTTAETASAAETAGGLLTTTKAMAETASAADTIASTLVAASAVAESASANDNVDATGGALVLPEVPTQVPGAGPPGPDGTDRRRFEIYLLPEEDDEKPRRKRRLRLKKEEIEEKVEAAVEYIEAGSPRPMAPRAVVAEASTLMGLDALLENDRKRVERTIYRYLQTLMEEEEEEGMAMMLLAA